MKNHKKDAYYFAHDANAQDDPKCMLLIEQLGMEGYGVFWGLIEKLREEPDFKLPLIVVPALATRWRVSKEKIEAIINKFGLFVIEDDLFFSPRLQRSMRIYQKIKKIKSKAGLKGNKIRWFKGIAELSHCDSRAIAPPSQLNEIKEKEIKEKETKENECVSSTHPHLLFIKNLKNIQQIKEQLTNEQCIELCSQYRTHDIQAILMKIDNYTGIDKYRAVYPTCLDWLHREKGIEPIAKKGYCNFGEIYKYVQEFGKLPEKIDYRRVFTTLPVTKEDKMKVCVGEKEQYVKNYLLGKFKL